MASVEPGGQEEDYGLVQKNKNTETSSIHASNSRGGTFHKQGRTEETFTSKNSMMIEKEIPTQSTTPFLITTATDDQLREAMSQGRPGYYNEEEYNIAVSRMVEKETPTQSTNPILIPIATEDQLREALSQGRPGYSDEEEYNIAVSEYNIAMSQAAVEMVTEMDEEEMVALDDDFSLTGLGMDLNQKVSSTVEVRHS